MENTALVPYTDPAAAEALAALGAAVRRIADAWQRLVGTIAEALGPVIRRSAQLITRWTDNWADAMLRAVATGKEWHLMKHARKARTRKKYRNLLLRRWLALLAEGGEEEDDA